jgi:hypothetical protein
MTTPNSEKRHIPSNVLSINSPSTLASPNNAPPPKYLDTICEIVEKWPGLTKQAIMLEGENQRQIRHPDKTPEALKAGFQTAFSTQATRKNKRILEWHLGQINDGGRVISDKSTCRYLLPGVNPDDVQLWEAPSSPLALDNRDQATVRDTRHNNKGTTEIRGSSPDARCAPEADESERDSEAQVGDGTQRKRGQPEGVGDHTSLQVMSSCADNNNQDAILPRIEGSKVTGDRLASTEDSVVHDKTAEITAYDEVSLDAQRKYFGSRVYLKKEMLGRARAAKKSLTELSSQSAQLEQSEDKDKERLSVLENETQVVRQRMHERAMEVERIHQNQSIISEEASVLEGKIRTVDEELEAFWAGGD